mgnify:FL=1
MPRRPEDRPFGAPRVFRPRHDVAKHEADVDGFVAPTENYRNKERYRVYRPIPTFSTSPSRSRALTAVLADVLETFSMLMTSVIESIS